MRNWHSKMKNKQQSQKARVHSDLGDFKLSISEFGEISGNLDIDKINAFLNKNLDDRKLEERDKD